MARVRFIANFDYKPTARTTIGYEAGWSGTVKRDCADKAVAAGKAELLDAKPSTEDPISDENSQS
jgi:hypothetical protein